jgi:hypothetical protein
MIGEDIYNGLREQAEWRGTLSSETVEPFECLCAGIQNDVQNSALGISITQAGMIHVLTANEPTDGIKNKQVYTYTNAQAIAQDVRIVGIKRRGGLTSLTPEAVNQ